MIYGNIFSIILKSRVVFTLSGVLLGVPFVTPSWGMDPPKEDYAPEFQAPRKIEYPSSEEAKPGVKLRLKKLKSSLTSKPKSTPQPNSGIPSRSRANTTTQLDSKDMPKLEPKSRSNSVVSLASKPRSGSTISKPKPKSQISPHAEFTPEKLINSADDLEKALNPTLYKALHLPEQYRSLKIAIVPQEPLNMINIHFEKLFHIYSKITALDISGLTLEALIAGNLRMKGLVVSLKSMLLEKVCLVNCDMQQIGMRWLSPILFRHTYAEPRGFADTLKELDLSRNKIDDLGAMEITRALMKNSVLMKLSLNSNQIGDIGAKSFAGLLGVNHTLKDLYLMDNEITGEGLGALLDSLNELCNFKMYLQGNVLELESNYQLLIFGDFSTDNIHMIKKQNLALILENNILYCKVHDNEKMKIPSAGYSSKGLHSDTLGRISSIISKYLEDGNWVKALGDLNKFKKEILRFTSRIGYTPLINDVRQYDVLKQALEAKNIQIYLPEVPNPYIIKHHDDSQ